MIVLVDRKLTGSRMKLVRISRIRLKPKSLISVCLRFHSGQISPRNPSILGSTSTINDSTRQFWAQQVLSMIVLVEPKIDGFLDEICPEWKKGQTELRDFVLT